MNLPAHIAGHEPVVFSVNEQNRNLGVLYCTGCTAFLQIKVSEEKSAQSDERIEELGWQVHVFTDLADDRFG